MVKAEDYHDAIDEQLNRCVDLLIRDVSQPELVVLHLLCGEAGEPGAIRRSAIRSRSADGETGTAGLRHQMRDFDRRNALLSIAEKWATATATLPGARDSVMSLDIGDHDGEPFSCVGGLSSGLPKLSLTISRDLIAELCPEEIAEPYLRFTYAGSQQQDLMNLMEDFQLARSSVLGRISSLDVEKEYVKKISGKPENSPDKSRYYGGLWRILTGIQNVALFFRAICGPEWVEKAGVRYFVSSFGGIGSSSVLMAIFFPCRDEDSIGSRVFSTLASNWQPFETMLGIELPDSGAYCDIHFDGPQDTANKIGQLLETIFNIRVQKAVALSATRWFMWLVEQLATKRHEGHPLDFYFMVGDRSQFEDSKRVTFKRFGEIGDDFDVAVKPLGIPISQAGPDIRKAIASLQSSFLSSEHYPWFQGGRYLLFWDVTSPAGQLVKPMLPYGLLKISGSSWSQYIDQVYIDKPGIVLPANILVYVGGSTGEAGVVITRISKVGPATIHRVMKYREKHWRLVGADERADALLTKVLVSPVIESAVVRKKIVDVVMRVAENPGRGGTLIVLRKDAKEQQFIRMGVPWRFGNEVEDVEALMSHDGATLIRESPGKEEWQFRLLLSGDSLDERTKRKLEELALNAAQKTPLSGVGSRRWSAALAAFRDEVEAIVVISQDGDIVSWRVPRGRLEEAEYILLREGGDVEVQKLSDFLARTELPVQT